MAWHRMAWLLATLLLVWGCRDAAPATKSDREPALSLGSETAGLDEAFRIDIHSIFVVFDYHPDSHYATAEARLTFTMRPGQSRPRFHFTPAQENPAVVQALRLDGEALDFSRDARVVAVPGSSQSIVELARTLEPEAEHVLEMEYRLELPPDYPRFSTEVNDLAGTGNEALFPTLNSPGELSRHRLTLRVHGARPYRCLGSGLLEKTAETAAQEWTLDSEREIASYTLLFVLMPVEDTLLEERVIDGVPVRIMAWRGGAPIPDAFRVLETWLPELQRDIGPYPAPRGLNVFLVSRGGGMEYYGGTITALWALRHEVLHGYFGCSLVERTYRDSWLDEALTQWFDDTGQGVAYTALSDQYLGNWVGSRAPVSVGFSNLAYTDGARIMQAIADRLGGRPAMAAFLSSLHRERLFLPLTTMDFLHCLRERTGLDLEEQFRLWLYNGQPETIAGNRQTARKRPDLSPPVGLRSILRRAR